MRRSEFLSPSPALVKTEPENLSEKSVARIDYLFKWWPRRHAGSGSAIRDLKNSPFHRNFLLDGAGLYSAAHEVLRMGIDETRCMLPIIHRKPIDTSQRIALGEIRQTITRSLRREHDDFNIGGSRSGQIFSTSKQTASSERCFSNEENVATDSFI